MVADGRTLVDFVNVSVTYRVPEQQTVVEALKDISLKVEEGALSDKNGLMCRKGTHSFARCEIRSAISTARPRSSASR